MNSSKIKMFLRVIIPIAIGLGVTIWLFNDEFSVDTFTSLDWTWQMILGFALAWIFMIGRDFGLAWRFHTIAHPQLSWGSAIKVDLMCAFTSAITPSAVGGSALAIFYLNREGVALGRAATLTLTTLFFDELFFVIFCPIIMLLVPFDDLFIDSGSFMSGVQIVFWLVYSGIVIYTSLLFMGIIVKPHVVSRLIKRLFMLKLLKRWRRGAFDMADNMILTSQEIKRQNKRWWINVFGATVLSWFSRYLVVNALFWGFVPDSAPFLVFSRQFVVWVLLMVSPTPGGSGISEWLFAEYYGDMIGTAQLVLVLALAWRIVSYYIYLVLGSALMPLYFKPKSHKIKVDQTD